MIPYPFLYIDEKQLRKDIKKAVKLYERIDKIDIKIDKKYKIMSQCKGYCSTRCINAVKMMNKLERKADKLYQQMRKITNKWSDRPDFIRKQLDSIEIISIAGRCYTVGFCSLDSAYGIMSK